MRYFSIGIEHDTLTKLEAWNLEAIIGIQYAFVFNGAKYGANMTT